MTNTSPSAAKKSVIGISTRRDGLLGSCLRCLFGRLLAGGIAEILEEIGIRPQHQPGVAGAQSRLIGLHGTIEGKEIRVLRKGFGEDAVALGVALAAYLLGERLCLGDQHGNVAVGLGADFLALLTALSADRRSLALPLGLHALIDGLAVLLRQIGAP